MSTKIVKKPGLEKQLAIARMAEAKGTNWHQGFRCQGFYFNFKP
jgi:hypothetical protein